MHPKDIQISDYTYALPEERIAKFPLVERGASKLLVHRGGKIEDSHFGDLSTHLPAHTTLVLNETKVVNARLYFYKPTGGKIEIFCLEPAAPTGEYTQALGATQSCAWTCMVGGIKKWKDEPIHAELEWQGKTVTVSAVRGPAKGQGHVINFSWTAASLPFAEILSRLGNLPLPPYLNRSVAPEDEETYQTVFAKSEGSVAAPTASLHFDGDVLKSLEKKGIDQLKLTLHVGAGTFKPVKEGQIGEHEMHAEYVLYSRGFLESLLTSIREGKTIVAGGTTACRSLESLFWVGQQLAEGKQVDCRNILVKQWEPYEQGTLESAESNIAGILTAMEEQQVEALCGKTQIIIAPGYKMKIVSGIITNFHQPNSTLLLLVAALLGDSWKSVYKRALANEYRFLSYGDGSLLFP